MSLPQPKLLPDPETQEYVLLEEYRVYLAPIDQTLIVSPGYRQNGFSEPVLAAGIAGFSSGDARVLAVSAIHDPLYEAELFARSVCDSILEWAMKQNCKASEEFAGTAYFFVREFGGIVWNRHTDASRAAARKFVSLEDGNTEIVV